MGFKKILPVTIAFLFSSWALNAEIRVQVQGLAASEGYLMVALFTKDGFMNEKSAVQKVRVPAGSKELILFKDVPAGQYAISLFHDLDGNGKLDKSFFGIPEEPYGFSRDAKASMGPPDFSDASFSYTPGKDLNLTINLVQP